MKVKEFINKYNIKRITVVKDNHGDLSQPFIKPLYDTLFIDGDTNYIQDEDFKHSITDIYIDDFNRLTVNILPYYYTISNETKIKKQMTDKEISEVMKNLKSA